MVYKTLFARNYLKLSPSEITLLHRKETLLQSIGFPWSPTVHWPLFYWFCFAYSPSCIDVSVPSASGFNCGSSNQGGVGFFLSSNLLAGEVTGPSPREKKAVEDREGEVCSPSFVWTDRGSSFLEAPAFSYPHISAWPRAPTRLASFLTAVKGMWERMSQVSMDKKMPTQHRFISVPLLCGQNRAAPSLWWRVRTNR